MTMQRRLSLILILLVPWLIVSVVLADDLVTAKVVGVADAKACGAGWLYLDEQNDANEKIG